LRKLERYLRRPPPHGGDHPHTQGLFRLPSFLHNRSVQQAVDAPYPGGSPVCGVGNETAPAAAVGQTALLTCRVALSFRFGPTDARSGVLRGDHRPVWQNHRALRNQLLYYII